MSELIKPEASASAINYERMQADMALRRLGTSPEHQAEVIAKHYAAHATMALNILELCKARRYSDDPQPLDEAIRYCIETIKRNHLHDFGIPLEWNNKEMNNE